MLLAACAGPTPTIPSYAGDPATGMPTLLPIATPTLDVVSPEQIGTGFLNAWQAGDYGLMYGLLSPDLREGMTAEAFRSAYSAPMHTTTALSVTVTPQTLSVDGGVAWVNFTEVWHTALFGALQANNRLNLIRAGDQWWVDWDRGAVWPDLTEGRSFGIEYQIPPRANIYDVTGAGLAVPAAIVTVGVVPEQMTDEPSVLISLAGVLGIPTATIQGRYAGQPRNWFIPIVEITAEQSLAHDEALSLPGIVRRERAGRLYPLDGVGAHAIGWVSPVPAERYAAYRERGYRGDEAVGISGLEAWGEATLAGRNGARLYLVGADGAYVGKMGEQIPERGRAIHATLDRALQAAAEAALGSRKGAIVALDVATGAVRAMASGPRFDNNVFVRPAETAGLNAVLADPGQPLLNRATLGTYPAGSVFKIVTMAAALGPGGMSVESPFNCPGYWDGLGVAARKVCWLETGHGPINLAEGLTASCNVVFYEVGARLNAIDTTALPTFARGFGLGAPTGLQELPEAAGNIPDPEWKTATYREAWGAGDTVNMAIGQGFVVVSPLQIARMVMAVANGGTLYRPHLVARIEGNERHPEQVTRPEVMGNVPVSAAQLALIREAMLGVTTNPTIGTATHRFTGLGIAVAGKTGTAETGRPGEAPHSWFAGYWPAHAPEIAMVVMLENVGEGSTYAAPMFRQVLEGYYGMEITPIPTPTPVGEGE